MVISERSFLGIVHRAPITDDKDYIFENLNELILRNASKFSSQKSGSSPEQHTFKPEIVAILPYLVN